jgi:hypothetical protein
MNMKIKFDEKEGFILTETEHGETYKTGFRCSFFFDIKKNELLALQNSSFPRKEQPNKKNLYGITLYLNPLYIKDTKQDIVCLVVGYDKTGEMRKVTSTNNLGDELNKGNEIIIEICNLVDNTII